MRGIIDVLGQPADHLLCAGSFTEKFPKVNQHWDYLKWWVKIDDLDDNSNNDNDENTDNRDNNNNEAEEQSKAEGLPVIPWSSGTGSATHLPDGAAAAGVEGGSTEEE
ncbi:homeodomain-interacting protein kinase 1-like isoform X1 [Lates japonicus]|uniref:Homeodomain-interacting protein kinase 1-like isoform X1 n=1 Tax=Lates japonicus TaxID=270547 RepID=A0AAD3RIZ1_LATJO|nr:homeodomain-interacting protein kinase 1-like isoform X1 [Lates japonicus]